MKIDNLTIDEINCFEVSRGNEVIISLSSNIGLGELTLYQKNEDDKYKADTEYMCTDEDLMKLVGKKVAVDFKHIEDISFKASPVQKVAESENKE